MALTRSPSTSAFILSFMTTPLAKPASSFSETSSVSPKPLLYLVCCQTTSQATAHGGLHNVQHRGKHSGVCFLHCPRSVKAGPTGNLSCTDNNGKECGSSVNDRNTCQTRKSMPSINEDLLKRFDVLLTNLERRGRFFETLAMNMPVPSTAARFAMWGTHHSRLYTLPTSV